MVAGGSRWLVVAGRKLRWRQLVVVGGTEAVAEAIRSFQPPPLESLPCISENH